MKWIAAAALGVALSIAGSGAQAAVVYDVRPAERVFVYGDWADPAFADGVEVGIDMYRRGAYDMRIPRNRITGGEAGTILFDHFKVYDPDGALVDSGTTRTARIEPFVLRSSPRGTGYDFFFGYAFNNHLHGSFAKPLDYEEVLGDGSKIAHHFDANMYLKIAVNSASQPFRLRVGEAPEPSTWALLIAGFGLTGGALRGRRKRLAYC